MKISQPLTLNELQPGMALAEPVRDPSGNVLLPPGAVLSEANIVSLGRRGVESLAVEQEVQEDSAAAEARRHQLAVRLDHLFRRAGDSETTRALRQAVARYRLGQDG